MSKFTATVAKISEQAVSSNIQGDGFDTYTVRVRVGKQGQKVHSADIIVDTRDGKEFIHPPVVKCGTRGGLYGIGVAQAVTSRSLTCEKCSH